ncbi:hypothetical protein J6590_100743 [Homalodisca vitripennis]|nr:hypothetical protein J6590_100743 [Homalodisca vitripennis]
MTIYVPKSFLTDLERRQPLSTALPIVNILVKCNERFICFLSSANNKDHFTVKSKGVRSGNRTGQSIGPPGPIHIRPNVLFGSLVKSCQNELMPRHDETTLLTRSCNLFFGRSHPTNYIMHGPLPRLHRLGNQLCRQFDFFDDSQSAIRGFFQSQVPRIPSLLNLGGISKPELHEADRDTASLYVELPTRCFFHNRIPGQRLYRLLDVLRSYVLLSTS